MENACKICRRLFEGTECPVCKSREITKNWKGVILIFDPESEIAKLANITVPGRYAINVIQ
jgi:DNA-directed RNA polymerase subunit E"